MHLSSIIQAIDSYDEGDNQAVQTIRQLLRDSGFELIVELALIVDIGYHLCCETYYMENNGPRFQYVYDRIEVLFARVTSDDTLLNMNELIRVCGVDNDQALQMWIHDKISATILPVRTYIHSLWKAGGTVTIG